MNFSALHNTCNASFNYLRKYGDYVPCSPHSGYTYIDNGSNVLGVAHIDTVQSGRSFRVSKNGKIVWSPRLDDRLGVYTLLKVLPNLGVNADILLCEDEEQGQSTARFFTPNKQYNWMFEFDRGGITTVLYQYDTPELGDILNQYGFILDVGIYTDICDLEHLGCVGINFATGYYNYHRPDAFAVISEWSNSVKQFVTFYRDFKDEYLEYDPSFLAYDDDWFMRDYRYLEEISWKEYKESEKCQWCGTWYTDSYNIGLIRWSKACERCLENGAG